MHWEPYDPSWLVALAREQAPEEPSLARSLSDCTTCFRKSPAYVYFVDPTNPNQPGSAWQFRENFVLEHPVRGDIVLDILKDGRVGGIEFLDEVIAQP